MGVVWLTGAGRFLRFSGAALLTYLFVCCAARAAKITKIAAAQSAKRMAQGGLVIHG